MEMKYVVPDMAQSFGTLEFAGESEPVFERDKNNRRVLARRSYNPVSYTHLCCMNRVCPLSAYIGSETTAFVLSWKDGNGTPYHIKRLALPHHS